MLYNIHYHHLSSSYTGIYNWDITDKHIPAATNFSIGVHPWWINENTVNRFEALLKNYDHHLAWGEMGLDKRCKTPMSLQQKVLTECLNIIKRTDQSNYRPVIFHCVKAYQELLRIKASHLHEQHPCIFHGFQGHYQLAKQIIDVNVHHYLSFGERILSSQTVQDCLRKINIERIFLETDNVQEGADNKLIAIYQKVSELKKLPMAEIMVQMEKNGKKIGLNFCPPQNSN